MPRASLSVLESEMQKGSETAYTKPLPLLPLVYIFPEEPPFHSSLSATSTCFSPLLATGKPSL